MPTPDQEITFAPDFFIIPSVVMLDPELQPLDANVYGIVYWFEKLRDGRCFASNATIAKMVGSSSGGVANALVRLRKQGYVHTIHDEKGQRKQIITLVGMSVNPYSNDEGGVHQTMNIIKNTKKEHMSDLTDEEKRNVNIIYAEYLVGFKIDAQAWKNSHSSEERTALLDEASKAYRLTPKRKDAIVRRLRDCGAEMVLRAIRNIARSDFHTGNNTTEWVAGLETFILRNYEKVEEWASKSDNSSQDWRKET